jgi:predicted naringenin-chalcone synthase
VDPALAPGLLAISRWVPPFSYDQPTVTAAVRQWLEEGGSTSTRLLSVYDNAGVDSRGSVVPLDEVFHPRDFEAQNDR